MSSFDTKFTFIFLSLIKIFSNTIILVNKTTEKSLENVFSTNEVFLLRILSESDHI